MRKRLHFHGPLKALCPEPVEIEADTAWDAIEGASRQLPGLKPNVVTGRRRLIVKGFETIEALKTRTEVVDLHIYPAMQFGKNEGFLQVLVGVALIVVGVITLNPNLIVAGTTMVIGAIMQMLMPVPTMNTNNEQQVRSKYLPGQANTVRIGTHVPILYGKFRAGGHILSLNIDAKDAVGA